jgi:hypothetical protein
VEAFGEGGSLGEGGSFQTMTAVLFLVKILVIISEDQWFMVLYHYPNRYLDRFFDLSHHYRTYGS